MIKFTLMPSMAWWSSRMIPCSGAMVAYIEEVPSSILGQALFLRRPLLPNNRPVNYVQ